MVKVKDQVLVRTATRNGMQCPNKGGVANSVCVCVLVLLSRDLME